MKGSVNHLARLFATLKSTMNVRIKKLPGWVSQSPDENQCAKKETIATALKQVNRAKVILSVLVNSFSFMTLIPATVPSLSIS
jgi:hypothetical protein